jgi:hypothetical protein
MTKHIFRKYPNEVRHLKFAVFDKHANEKKNNDKCERIDNTETKGKGKKLHSYQHASTQR